MLWLQTTHQNLDKLWIQIPCDMYHRCSISHHGLCKDKQHHLLLHKVISVAQHNL